MPKKQYRIRQAQLQLMVPQWEGKAVSVVLHSGAVYEVVAQSLQEGSLLCTDHGRLRHRFPLVAIKELILDFPVAEHAQTSAD